MIGFFKDLWNNVFTPGSSPAVVKATHASFVLLEITIMAMLFVTRSYHFVFLFILSTLLWVTTAWFITEYNKFLEQKEKEPTKEEEGEKAVIKDKTKAE